MSRPSGLLTASALLVALAVSACTDSEESPPPDRAPIPKSAWQAITDRFGPEGQVSLELALDAFATLVAPIHGGTALRRPTRASRL